MFTHKHIINLISVFIAALMGGIFISLSFPGKYGLYAGPFYIFLYLFIIVTVERLIKGLKIIKNSPLRRNLLFIFSAALVIAVIISVSFTSRLPVYQLLPSFVFNLFSYITLLYLLVSTSGSFPEAIVRVLMLLISPLSYSGLFSNESIALPVLLILMFLLLTSNDKKRRLLLSVLALPVLVSAVYLTEPGREAFILPAFSAVVFSLYLFRQKLLWLAISVGVIAAVLIILPSGDMGLIMVPAVLVLLIALFAGWSASTPNEALFVSALMMVLYLLISQFIANDWGQVLTSAGVIIPYLIFSVEDYRVDKFLGRVFQPK